LANLATATEATGPIQKSLCENEELIEEVHRLLNRLRERLEPVLRSPRADNALDPKDTTGGSSAMHGALDRQKLSLVSATMKIHNMMDELEL
jgi:hypothetical protein